MKQIPLFWPHVNKKAVLKEIKDTLDSRWIGQGPKVDKFEQEFGKKFKYKYPVFVNSGTSALELAYHLVGLKKGDEVIVPVLDCTAGQSGLLRRGVKIVFADIRKDTFNIDPDDVLRKITKKTKAVVIVHLGGIDAYDGDLYEELNERGIKIIADASQHHEPKELGGDYICYSFQAIKHLTTCDGGMLILKNEKEYKRAKLLRWFGIDRDLKKKHNYQSWERRQMTFDIEEAGYKYQPTDVDACFGIVGLKELDKVLKIRKELVGLYKKELKDVIPIEIVAGGSCWLMGIKDLSGLRDDLAEWLRKNGIDANMVHIRNDMFNVFKKFKSKCPNMDEIHEQYLYLPLNTKVSKSDVKYICNKIKEFYGYTI